MLYTSYLKENVQPIMYPTYPTHPTHPKSHQSEPTQEFRQNLGFKQQTNSSEISRTCWMLTLQHAIGARPQFSTFFFVPLSSPDCPGSAVEEEFQCCCHRTGSHPQNRSSAASADKTEHAQKKFDALDLIHSHFLNEITHFFYTSIAELAMLWFCLEGVQAVERLMIK